MPMYSIVRVEKLKTLADVRAASNHHTRAQPVPNANPARKIQVNHRGQSPYDAVVRHLRKVERWRRDNVVAAEIVLTANPGFFRTDPTAYGSYEDDRVRAFAERAVTWLHERYGENLVSVALHLDEATPHIHAIIVPLVDGRLSARSMFFLMGKFSEIQDSFAAAMEPLGLVRGEPGSSANHQDIRNWYETEPRRLRAVAEELDERHRQLLEEEQNLARRMEAVETWLGELAEVDPAAAASGWRRMARTFDGRDQDE